jgi:hypothetical protein
MPRPYGTAQRHHGNRNVNGGLSQWIGVINALRIVAAGSA